MCCGGARLYRGGSSKKYNSKNYQIKSRHIRDISRFCRGRKEVLLREEMKWSIETDSAVEHSSRLARPLPARLLRSASCRWRLPLPVRTTPSVSVCSAAISAI